MRSLCLIVVISMFIQYSATTFKQERATVRRCNSKYVEECYCITRRVRRGESYKTNITTVTRYQWGNNVTYKLVLLQSGFPVEVVKVKMCDLENIKWLWEYFKLYSNVVGKCPQKPGSYGLYNMELPPKDLPQSIMKLIKGKTHVSFMAIVTATEEIILEYSITVS